MLTLLALDAHTKMQDIMMRQFFFFIDDEYKKYISYGDLDSQVCGVDSSDDWLGIACADNIVESISFCDVNVGNFSLEYLPHSVKGVHLIRASQSNEIATRYLPRYLIDFEVNTNQVYGTVDLGCLPAKIKRFILSSNRIFGNLNLTALPDSLCILDLSFNNIAQQTVYYGNLPSSIERIDLVANNIREVKPLNCDESAKFRHIFDIDIQQTKLL